MPNTVGTLNPIWATRSIPRTVCATP